MSTNVSCFDGLRLSFKAHNPTLLDNFIREVCGVVSEVGARMRGPIPLPTSSKGFVYPKSPHVDKRSQEHLALIVHRRVLMLQDVSQAVVQSLRGLDMPFGVHLDIKHLGVSDNTEG